VVSLIDSSPTERIVPAIETGFTKKKSKLLMTKDTVTAYRNGAINRTKVESSSSSELPIELHVVVREVDYDRHGDEQFQAPRHFGKQP
jgi:hypothetical protein